MLRRQGAAMLFFLDGTGPDALSLEFCVRSTRRTPNAPFSRHSLLKGSHDHIPPHVSPLRRLDGGRPLPLASRTSGRRKPSRTARSGWGSSAWAQNRGTCWAASSARTRRCWPCATLTRPAARRPRSGSTSSTPARSRSRRPRARRTTISGKSSTARTSTRCASPRPTTGMPSSRWPRCGAARTCTARSR